MTIRFFAGRDNRCSTEQDPALAQQLAAMEIINRLTADQAKLAATYQAAVQWAADAELVFACVEQENQALRAENERLRARLAAAPKQQPAHDKPSNVISLQERGAA